VPKNPVVLLVDDRVEDSAPLQEHFEAFAGTYQLRVVQSGLAAQAYLRGDGKYSNRRKYPFPAAVLLDLGMPEMDGFQVLDWIKSQPMLKHLPVAVLTEPTEIRQVTRAYQMGAKTFLMKPPPIEELRDMLPALLQGHGGGLAA